MIRPYLPLNGLRAFEAALTPLGSPEVAARLREPADLAAETLLRPYRAGEWPAWLEAACPRRR
jgi:LysR family transcriptional regulator of beta-lactamase